jgi:hypothetical protein
MPLEKHGQFRHVTLELWEPQQVRKTPSGRFRWMHLEGNKIFELVHTGDVEDILRGGAVLRIRCVCSVCLSRRAKGRTYDVLASKVEPLNSMDDVTLPPPPLPEVPPPPPPEPSGLEATLRQFINDPIIRRSSAPPPKGETEYVDEEYASELLQFLEATKGK